MLKLAKSSLLLLIIASPSFAGQQSGGMPELSLLLEESTFNGIIDHSFTTPVSVTLTDTDEVSGYTRTHILLLTNGNDNEMIFANDDSRIVTIKKVSSLEEASPGEIYLEDGMIKIDIEVKAIQ